MINLSASKPLHQPHSNNPTVSAPLHQPPTNSVLSFNLISIFKLNLIKPLFIVKQYIAQKL